MSDRRRFLRAFIASTAGLAMGGASRGRGQPVDGERPRSDEVSPPSSDRSKPVEGASAENTESVQAMIDRKAADGGGTCRVPEDILPYDPSRVRFDEDVVLARRGGCAFGIDVTAYGAVGDGSADDTRAIRAAIDATRSVSDIGASENTGAVLFPVGDYRITSPVLVDSGLRLVGESRSGSRVLVDGDFAAFKARRQGDEPCYHFQAADLTVNNLRKRPENSMAFDLRGCSLALIRSVRLRKHDTAVLLQQAGRAGFYNELMHCEIASNRVGIAIGRGGNSNKIFGGRINGNRVGVRVGPSDDNLISTTFESNERGVVLEDGAKNHTILQSRFEGQREIAVEFLPGASYNLVLGSALVNHADAVIDRDGRNQVLGDPEGGISTPTSVAQKNLLPNGTMSRDSDGDGLANGATLGPASVPTGSTVRMNDQEVHSGRYSQEFTVSGSGTSMRSLGWSFQATPGLPHVVVARVKTDFEDDPWDLRVGESPGAREYTFTRLRAEPDFYTIVNSFVPEVDTVHLTLNMSRTIAEGIGRPVSLYVDAVYAGVGLSPGIPGQEDHLHVPRGRAKERPENPRIGETFFDTSLSGSSGKPIWWNGSEWVDARGDQV